MSFTVLVATGCSKKFLEDMRSFDQYDENIFTNETQTGWYVDRMYNDYFATYRSPISTVAGLYTDDRSKLTEEIGGIPTTGVLPRYLDATQNFVNATDGDTYFGVPLAANNNNNPYTRIRNCNFLLKKIDEKGQNLPEQFRKRARGQAFFLRALQYFDLVRVFGGVPIVTTVQQASPDDESIKAPRAKTSEVIAQIVKDLDTAAALLPPVWEASGWGRMSGSAALALKSRVLLTAASPLFNASWDDPGSDRWQKALEAGLDAETKLTAAGHGLYGSTAKEWSEMWYKNDNVFNKEAIMVQLMSNNTAASGYLVGSWERSIRPVKQGGAGGTTAPKGMIDLFPLADGTRPKSGVNYVDSLFFLNRDPRFYRTFAFTGLKWGTKDNANDTLFAYRWQSDAATPVSYYSDNTSSSSPALVSKMSNPNAAVATMAYSGTDIMEYRYAELLLNIAECYAAKNDLANCLVYLGKIRNRVGIPQGSNNWGIGTLTSKYAALEACLYERRVELAYEGKRFWDVQRWCLYADDAAFGNTVSKLGVTALNGTARTGYYWQFKTKTAAGSTASRDPLTGARGKFFADPDAANFKVQLDTVAAFFKRSFNIVPLEQPMDRVTVGSSSVANLISFKQNYYIAGLPANVLGVNPYLLQTKGWNDYNGAPGTYNYRD